MDEFYVMGFKVTVWVMSFIVEDIMVYREGKDKGYFVNLNM